MSETGSLNGRTKLAGYEFYKKVLGSPKYVVAPMVDQSELAWRKLSRKYGAQLVYTPMINAKMFAEGVRKPYRDQNFNITKGEEGDPSDRPLIVQFCANDPDKLLAAAKIVEPYCDAVDINLGCPQDIARRGHYGSFLQDEWELIYKLINILHTSLSVPVTAKFRVFPTVDKTVEYAKMLESAGAQILTCHGRTRDQRGHRSGLADWDKIRAVKEAVKVPVFANGNVLFYSDIEKCLKATGADGVMSAEGNLYNPTIFSPAPSTLEVSESDTPLSEASLQWRSGLHLPHTQLALEYLDIVKSQATPTSPGAVKGHLFKLMRPALGRETDLREKLGKVRIVKGKEAESLQQYEAIVKELGERMQRDIKEAGDRPLEELVTIDENTGLPILPHWLAQPYFRPLSSVEEPTKATNGKKEVVALKDAALVEQAVELEPCLTCDGTIASKRTASERTPEPTEEPKRIKLADEREPTAIIA